MSRFGTRVRGKKKGALVRASPARAKDAESASQPPGPLGRGQGSHSSAPWLRGPLPVGATCNGRSHVRQTREEQRVASRRPLRCTTPPSASVRTRSRCSKPPTCSAHGSTSVPSDLNWPSLSSNAFDDFGRAHLVHEETWLALDPMHTRAGTAKAL